MSPDVTTLVAPAPDDLRLLALLLVPTAAYLVMFYGLAPTRLARTSTPDEAARAVLRSKAGGGVVLGLGAALAAVLAGHGVLELAAPDPRPLATLAWVLGGAAVFVPIVGSSARKPPIWSRYPEIRRDPFDAATARRSAGAWALYLLGYEYMFRGVLLFGLASRFGVWAALAITTALYVVVHLPKMASETASCLAMGIVFGAMSISSGSFVAAWLLHVLIALTSETVAAAFDPGRRAWSDRWLRTASEQDTDDSRG